MVGASCSSSPKSTAQPLAAEAVRRIDAIFDAERTINGQPAEQRLAIWQAQIAPLVSELGTWMREQRGRMSRHAEVGKAMDYMLTRWDAFTRFLGNGRICLTNNAAERALRGIAVNAEVDLVLPHFPCSQAPDEMGRWLR